MKSITYRDAGLDLDKYEESLSHMPPLMRRTHGPRVLDGFGGFASLFSLDFNSRLFARNYRHPVLVTCTDGVGTKLKIASMMGKHDTVGIDLVAMSVNDALCCGGEPLVFLDYLAMPSDDPPLTRDIIKGISDGCLEAECSLVGGETAILPDFYKPGDYDLAGFCVGVVEKEHIVNGRAIQPGDQVIGLGSSGVHSNGYSLVRKIVFEHTGLRVDARVAELGRTVGEELLENAVEIAPTFRRRIGLGHTDQRFLGLGGADQRFAHLHWIAGIVRFLQQVRVGCACLLDAGDGILALKIVAQLGEAFDERHAGELRPSGPADGGAAICLDERFQVGGIGSEFDLSPGFSANLRRRIAEIPPGDNQHGDQHDGRANDPHARQLLAVARALPKICEPARQLILLQLLALFRFHAHS